MNLIDDALAVLAKQAGDNNAFSKARKSFGGDDSTAGAAPAPSAASAPAPAPEPVGRTEGGIDANLHGFLGPRGAPAAAAATPAATTKPLGVTEHLGGDPIAAAKPVAPQEPPKAATPPGVSPQPVQAPMTPPGAGVAPSVDPNAVIRMPARGTPSATPVAGGNMRRVNYPGLGWAEATLKGRPSQKELAAQNLDTASAEAGANMAALGQPTGAASPLQDDANTLTDRNPIFASPRAKLARR